MNQENPIPSAFKPVENREDYEIIEGNDQSKEDEEKEQLQTKQVDEIDINLKENISKLNINKTEKANVNTITNNTQNISHSNQVGQKKKKKNKKKKWPPELKSLAVEKALTMGVTHAIDSLCAEDSNTYSQLSPSTLKYWVNQRTKKTEKKEKKDQK